MCRWVSLGKSHVFWSSFGGVKANVWGQKSSVLAQLCVVGYVQVCEDGWAFAILRFVGPVWWCGGSCLGSRVFDFGPTLCGWLYANVCRWLSLGKSHVCVSSFGCVNANVWCQK